MIKYKPFVLVPVVFFLLIVAFLWRGLSLDPHHLPSVLINKPFPDFELSKVLDPSTRVTRQDLVGKPALVHVWATWCQVCAYEHKNLVKIAKNSSYPIFGINYRDDPVLARRWLLVEGDPYQIAIQDEKGKLGLDLGIYGTPEMFILDAQGIIRYRQVGPIDEQYYYAKLVPLLKKLEDEKYVIP